MTTQEFYNQALRAIAINNDANHQQRVIDAARRSLDALETQLKETLESLAPSLEALGPMEPVMVREHTFWLGCSGVCFAKLRGWSEVPDVTEPAFTPAEAALDMGDDSLESDDRLAQVEREILYGEFGIRADRGTISLAPGGHPTELINERNGVH